MDILFPEEIVNPVSLSCIPPELLSVNCGDYCWFAELIKYFATLGIWITGSHYYGIYLGLALIWITGIILFLAGAVVGSLLNYLLNLLFGSSQK